MKIRKSFSIDLKIHMLKDQEKMKNLEVMVLFQMIQEIQNVQLFLAQNMDVIIYFYNDKI